MSGGGAILAVLGAGQMGAGIAHVAALAGHSVGLHDRRAAALPAAMESIRRNLARQAKKGAILAADADAAAARIRPQTEIGGWLAMAEFVIEAASENRDAKRALYGDIRGKLSAGAILASNTSSYSISELAAATDRPARFIGMHFMNPPPLMPLVEVIPGAETSEETTAKTEELAAALGKQTVRAADRPGFITNRLLLPFLNEAVFALQDGVGGVADIDKAMRLGMRHPMGPLALADFIGLDTCLEILNVLHAGLDGGGGGGKYAPCPLLRRMVEAGELGRKSGAGFYDYRGGVEATVAGRFLR